MVKIRAYNASGKLYTESRNTIRIASFTLGTRVLLTCDVTGLPEGSEVIKYKWYHNCTRPMCEIPEGTPTTEQWMTLYWWMSFPMIWKGGTIVMLSMAMNRA